MLSMKNTTTIIATLILLALASLFTPASAYTDDAYDDLVSYLVGIRDNPPNTAVKGNPVHIAKWNRVLTALGHNTAEPAMPAATIHANAAQWPDSPFKPASDYLKWQEQHNEPEDPEIAISAGSAVTEGGSAIFTLTATPAPASPLAVGLSVTTSGDYGVAAGARTATIPVSGSYILSLPTTNDEVDEPDGSVTVAIASGDGYTTGSSASGSVAVRDDDEDTTNAVDTTDRQSVIAYILQVRDNPTDAWARGGGNAAHVAKWNQVLAALGHGTSESPMAESIIHANADKWPDSHFKPVSEFLNWIDAQEEDSQQDQDVEPQQVQALQQPICDDGIETSQEGEVTVVTYKESRLRKSCSFPVASHTDAHRQRGIFIPGAKITGNAWSSRLEEPQIWGVTTAADSVTFDLGPYEDYYETPDFESSVFTAGGRKWKIVVENTGKYVPEFFTKERASSYPEGTVLASYQIRSKVGNRLYVGLDAPFTRSYTLRVEGAASFGTDFTLGCLPVSNISCTMSGQDLIVTITGPMTPTSLAFLKIAFLKDNIAEQGESFNLKIIDAGGTVLDTWSTTIVTPPETAILRWTRSRFEVFENRGLFQPVLRITPPFGEDIPFSISTSGTATRSVIDGNTCAGPDYCTESDHVLPAGRSTYSFDFHLVSNEQPEPEETIRIYVDTSRFPGGVSFGSNSPYADSVIFDNPRDSHRRSDKRTAKECFDATLQQGEHCGPGGHQVLVEHSLDDSKKTHTEGDTITYWLYASPPPMTGTVRVSYTLEGRTNQDPRFIDIFREGRQVNIRLPGDSLAKEDDEQVVKWATTGGSNYHIHDDGIKSSFFVHDDDPMVWDWIAETFHDKIYEGTTKTAKIAFDSRKGLPGPNTNNLLGIDLNVSGCALTSIPISEDAEPVNGTDIPCYVDIHYGLKDANVHRLSEDEFQIWGWSPNQKSFVIRLQVGNDTDKADETITMDPQFVFNRSSGGIQGSSDNAFPGTFVVVDDDEFDIPDEEGKDTVYYVGTSVPATPTGGTSIEDHTPTDWSRDALAPTATENVYRSQRDLTIVNDAFVSATAWGAPEKILDAVPAELTVSWARDSFSVLEPNGPSQPVIVADNPASRDYQIPYTIIPGTAQYPQDFGAHDDGTIINPLKNTVLLPAGETRVSFEVFLVNDDIIEPDETFTIELGPFPLGTEAGATTITTVLITDNDELSDAEKAAKEAEEQAAREAEERAAFIAKTLADVARNERCHPEDNPDTAGVDESTVAPIDDPATPDIDESDCIANIKMELVTTEITEGKELVVKDVGGTNKSSADIAVRLTSDLDYTGPIRFIFRNVRGNRLVFTGSRSIQVENVELTRGVRKDATIVARNVFGLNNIARNGLIYDGITHDSPDGWLSVAPLIYQNLNYHVIAPSSLPEIHVQDKESTGIAINGSDIFLDNQDEGDRPDFSLSFHSDGNWNSTDTRNLRQWEWVDIPIVLKTTPGEILIDNGLYEIKAFGNQENVRISKSDRGYNVRIDGRPFGSWGVERTAINCATLIVGSACLDFISHIKPDNPLWEARYDTDGNFIESVIPVKIHIDVDLEVQTDRSSLSGGWKPRSLQSSLISIKSHTPDSTTSRSFKLSADETTIAEPASGYAYVPFEMEIFPVPSGPSGFAFCAGGDSTASYYRDYTIYSQDDYQLARRFPDMAKFLTGYAWTNGGSCSRPIQTRGRYHTFYLKVIADSHDEGAEKINLHVSQRTPKPDGNIADSNVLNFTINNDGPIPAAWLARFGRTIADQAVDVITARIFSPRESGMQGSIAGHALRFDAQGHGVPMENAGLEDDLNESGTMTAAEALLGSSFSWTGQSDDLGASTSFWGRMAQDSFDGREGDLSLDGRVTTAMLGADYSRRDWLFGVAITRSRADGSYYRDANDGTNTVEASLTAAVPYAALQATERLNIWGAMGYGVGELVLNTTHGEHLDTDTSWRMLAMGMRGELLEAAGEDAGPALALTSDALWARTASEQIRGLKASESDVTRLRLGIEGSYHVAMEDGASLVPKLEVGARHDGGDAETGFGIEVGGGIAWTDPGMGLSLDLSGRTLLAHGDDDLKDRGFSVALAFDPAPGTKRGASLSLRQDFGGQAAGGLDALFQPATLDDRTGSEATSRWGLEAAYGLPILGGRWTGSPHVGLGLATGARDYSLGWRLTPEAANAPDFSFGLKATRRESEAAEAEHTVGVEIAARW